MWPAVFYWSFPHGNHRTSESSLFLWEWAALTPLCPVFPSSSLPGLHGTGRPARQRRGSRGRCELFRFGDTDLDSLSQWVLSLLFRLQGVRGVPGLMGEPGLFGAKVTNIRLRRHSNDPKEKSQNLCWCLQIHVPKAVSFVRTRSDTLRQRRWMSVLRLQGSKGDRGARGPRGRVGAAVSERGPQSQGWYLAELSQVRTETCGTESKSRRPLLLFF